MTKPKRIYLAGPEVFFPAGEHQAIVAEKKRLLNEYGFEGVDPLDTALAFSDDEAKPNNRSVPVFPLPAKTRSSSARQPVGRTWQYPTSTSHAGASPLRSA